MPTEAREGIRPHGSGVAGGCKPLDVGTGNQTQILHPHTSLSYLSSTSRVSLIKKKNTCYWAHQHNLGWSLHLKAFGYIWKDQIRSHPHVSDTDTGMGASRLTGARKEKGDTDNMETGRTARVSLRQARTEARKDFQILLALGMYGKFRFSKHTPLNGSRASWYWPLCVLFW